MKRTNLVRYLAMRGCLLLREGKRHTLFYNPKTERTSTVPRHNEINDFLAIKFART